MKPTVYLDTTIPSYLFDQRKEIETFIDITKQWWAEERDNYNLVISEAVVLELGAGNHPHKREILETWVPLVETLQSDARIEEVAQVYIDHYLMPRKLTGDALHLAYASFHKADFLMTWNCNHLANANKKQHIRIINTQLNLFTPDLVTPLELFTEKNT